MPFITKDSYNFNVADTSDIGADWDNGYSTWSNCQIVSNAVRPSEQFTSCAETYNKTINAGQAIKYYISQLTTTVSSFCVCNLRYAAPPTRSGYEVIWDMPNSGSFTVEIAIRRNGTKTTLAGPTAATYGQGSGLYAAIQGNDIWAFVDDTQVLSHTLGVGEQDFSSGRPGFRLVTSGVVSALCIDDLHIDEYVTDNPITASGGNYTLSGIIANLRQGSVTTLRYRR